MILNSPLRMAIFTWSEFALARGVSRGQSWDFIMPVFASVCLPTSLGVLGRWKTLKGGGVPSQHRGRVSIWQLGLCLFSGKTSVLVLVNHERVESQHLLEHSRDLWGTTWGASKRGLFSTSPLCELKKLVTRKLLLAIPLSCLRKVSLVSLPSTSKGKQNVTVSCLVRADGIWEVTSEARVHRADPETGMRMLEHRRLGRKGTHKAESSQPSVTWC